MHHEMKFRVGGGTQDPTIRQNCLDRSGLAQEKEGASGAVISFCQVDLACDGAAIFVVIPLGKSDRWTIASFGCCHGDPFPFRQLAGCNSAGTMAPKASSRVATSASR